MKKRETLHHPDLGHLPARKVLECIFALSPSQQIIHHHLEEVSRSEEGGESGEIQYTLTGTAPNEGRERCQIIPPLVTEFDPPAFPAPQGAAS